MPAGRPEDLFQDPFFFSIEMFPFYDIQDYRRENT